MRGRPIAIQALLVVLVAGLSSVAFANPPGIPSGSHKVYQFNMIGYPEGQAYTGNCGQGNRIFINRGANRAQIRVTNGSAWDVTDCNATTNSRAELTTNDAGMYDIYVRMLGKPGGQLYICAQTMEDFELGETLCLIGTLDLTRNSGKSRFSIAPSVMFDAALEDLMWTANTNSNFRLAQFRVYTRPTP